MGKIRADALLARFGYCSRREAVFLIKSKKLTDKQNVAITNPAQKIAPEEVLVEGMPVDFPNGIFIALNKPLGYTCSHSTDEGSTIYELIPVIWSRRNPAVTTIGRLDKETSGLIFLTDQGELVHRLTSPKTHLEKEYELTVDCDFPPNLAEIFASGELVLQGEKTPCLPAKFAATEPHLARLVLTEGRYHQVRRMLASQGCTVLTLKRIRIGDILLDQLKIEPGEWMEISPPLI